MKSEMPDIKLGQLLSAFISELFRVRPAAATSTTIALELALCVLSTMESGRDLSIFSYMKQVWTE